MANFVSVGQSLAPMLGMWLLAEQAPSYVWWGFALGQTVVALLVVVFASILYMRNKQLVPVVLVPRGEQAEGFETSILPTVEAMDQMLGEMDSFLKHHLSDSSLIMHIEVCSEELLKNIVTHGYAKQGKRHYIDYRLSISPDKRVSVVVSDDARAFNPVEYDQQTGLGLLLVRGLCQDIRYDYLFRQNVVSVSFSRD